MKKTCETCKFRTEPATFRVCHPCKSGPDGNTNWTDKAFKARTEAAKICQGGASNPIPISKALHDAILEVRKEGGNEATDAAVYLILHQLAYILTGVDIAEPSRYCRASEEVGL